MGLLEGKALILFCMYNSLYIILIASRSLVIWDYFQTYLFSIEYFFNGAFELQQVLFGVRFDLFCRKEIIHVFAFQPIAVEFFEFLLTDLASLVPFDYSSYLEHMITKAARGSSNQVHWLLIKNIANRWVWRGWNWVITLFRGLAFCLFAYFIIVILYFTNKK